MISISNPILVLCDLLILQLLGAEKFTSSLEIELEISLKSEALIIGFF